MQAALKTSSPERGPLAAAVAAPPHSASPCRQTSPTGLMRASMSARCWSVKSTAAALKAMRILANARRVVAAELLCAAQGLTLLVPLRPGRGVERLYERVRTMVHPLTGDRPVAPDLENLAELIAKEDLP